MARGEGDGSEGTVRRRWYKWSTPLHKAAKHDSKDFLDALHDRHPVYRTNREKLMADLGVTDRYEGCLTKYCIMPLITAVHCCEILRFT